MLYRSRKFDATFSSDELIIDMLFVAIKNRNIMATIITAPQII